VFSKLGKFFREYYQLGWVIIFSLLALILTFIGQNKIANIILAITAIINVIPLVIGMIKDIRHGTYGVDILAVTAIVTSVVLGEYWAGIIIVLMLTGGEALEDYAENRAKTELSSLLKKAPQKAHLVRGRKILDVKVEKVQVGDKILIKPGEVVPVDGIIIDGTSSFDESSLTGESLPVEKSINEDVLSGSVNVEGLVTIKAIRSAANSQYEQIIKLVKSASIAQTPFVRLADRYSIPFTILSFIIAGGAWAMSGESIRFLQVLVVATPCPLILGAPIALISGISRSARHGIIIKNGSSIEKLAEVKTVAFDKTGTLTIGKPVVKSVSSFGKYKDSEVIALAASLEHNSNHILAKAITQKAVELKLKIAKVNKLKELPGNGLEGYVGKKHVIIGKKTYFEKQSISIPKVSTKSDLDSTSSFVAVNNQVIGKISFEDKIRPESKKMLNKLKQLKIKYTLMVTGDNKISAQKVAKQLGISEVKYDCLPADKLSAIESIKHRPVAFVGDGVNDAPVLTASDVGIALGARGSTAASETADVVIMLDDVNKVSSSIDIAKKTLKIAKQSIMIGILISIGLMLVYSTGQFSPASGAAIQEVVDIIVILYALRAHGPWKKRPS
jgi:heavy metal translocating P-type ATPase